MGQRVGHRSASGTPLRPLSLVALRCARNAQARARAHARACAPLSPLPRVHRAPCKPADEPHAAGAHRAAELVEVRLPGGGGGNAGVWGLSGGRGRAGH